MNQPLMPSHEAGGEKLNAASPRSHPPASVSLRLRTRAVLFGILAAAILTGLIGLDPLSWKKSI
jgi:hypothetical protein